MKTNKQTEKNSMEKIKSWIKKAQEDENVQQKRNNMEQMTRQLMRDIECSIK